MANPHGNDYGEGGYRRSSYDRDSSSRGYGGGGYPPSSYVGGGRSDRDSSSRSPGYMELIAAKGGELVAKGGELVAKGGRRLINSVIESISPIGEDPGLPVGVCPQCHTRVPPDRDFCSTRCCDHYWRDYRNYHMYTTGRREAVCRFPGCDKPCYVDTYRVHNYCGKTHALEHQKMLGGAPQDDKATQRAPSYWRAMYDWYKTGPIRFYNKNDPYYEFTNFYQASIYLDGKQWPTTEHYFQAQKFVGTPYVEEIRILPTARMVFDRSRDPRVYRWCRKDWEEVKIEVMYKALLAKFSQHRELGELLEKTRDRELIEESPYDSYWGNGGDDTGQNMLGKLLKKVRDELRGKSTKMPRPRQFSTPAQRSGVVATQPCLQHPSGPPPQENEGQMAGAGGFMAGAQRQNSGSAGASTTLPVDHRQYQQAPETLQPRVHSDGGSPNNGGTNEEPMDTESASTAGQVTRL